MSRTPSDLTIDQPQADAIFKKSQAVATEKDLEFTGSISPQDAWALFQSQYAIIVDVRTNEERKFVGYVPDTQHVAWATGTSFNRNPRFVKELETKVGGKDKIILLLCRSGKRSALAAAAAHQAGFENIYNIEQGFEGDLNDDQQRGSVNGWRYQHLPWQQD